MKLETEYGHFEPTKEDVIKTLAEIEQVIPFELGLPFTNYKKYREQKIKINELYNDLYLKTTLASYPDNLVNQICNILDSMVEILLNFEFTVAEKICDLRLAWDRQSPYPWYLKGKIKYQRFVMREVNVFEPIIEIFDQVVELVERLDSHHDLGFWSYAYMANLYLYRILSGETALKQAMKYYNRAYRYAQVHDIDVEDKFIFDNVEILQKILMNRYPLLIIAYNQTGLKLYHYLFQFVEVMTEDQRFIPNFTALLSVLDERINTLFKSYITNAYVVIDNRLMVISKLYNSDGDKWIKLAFVFSYLHQDNEFMEVDDDLLSKVRNFISTLQEDDKLMEYFREFDGKYDHEMYLKVENIMQEIFM